MKTPTIVVLVGKVGHGKTFLLNKLTRSHYPSNAGAASCTRSLQFGCSEEKKMFIVDTPGFYASDNLAEHLAAQKIALEGQPISSVFLVVKYGRADELALEACRVIEFVGDEDIRIIITHSDTVSCNDGFDPDALCARLSDLLAISASNIKVVGKTTSATSIEQFMTSVIHPPKKYTISLEQTTAVSSLCACARRFDKAIRSAEAKIAAASLECNRKVTQYGRSQEIDTAITVIQKATTDMVQTTKENIFRDVEDFPDDQKHTIYGKAGLALTLRLKVFVEATNKLLSWDVTDGSDPRNLYKACPYCGAVFVKTEGCDGATICGEVPSSVGTERPSLGANFHKTDDGWTLRYQWNGQFFIFERIIDELRSLRQIEYHPSLSGNVETKNGLNIESGCGARVSWSTMIPIDPSKLDVLGAIELQREGAGERKAKHSFTEAFEIFQAKSKKSFLDAISSRI